jgi:glycosyltransferase involved in cell wall biosynthesis
MPANEYNRVVFKNDEIKGFISVIIPVFNDPAGLKVTLESLVQQNLDNNRYEIVVGNDGGDPETGRLCDSMGVKHVDLTPNQGSYAARNAALTLSRGECIAFIDADIFAPPDWLKKGIDGLSNADYCGGKVDINDEMLKTPAHYYEYISAFDNRASIKKYSYAPTANVFVKRSVLTRIGGFDHRLQSGGDAEFGSRVRSSGSFTMIYEPAARVLHPPRGRALLMKKLFRTMRGSKVLYGNYPERFAFLKPGMLTWIKMSLIPLRVFITKSRTVPLRIKPGLLFFSIFFSWYYTWVYFKVNFLEK